MATRRSPTGASYERDGDDMPPTVCSSRSHRGPRTCLPGHRSRKQLNRGGGDVERRHVNVRYMVTDVDDSIGFYTGCSASRSSPVPLPAFADVNAATSGCCCPGRRARPGGRCPTASNPGRAVGTGSTSSSTIWRRRSSGCGARGADFRNDIVARPGWQADPAARPLGQCRRAVRAGESLSRDRPSYHRGGLMVRPIDERGS